MDPIADKLLVMSAFVVLVGQGRMPSWACIIVLGASSSFPASASWPRTRAASSPPGRWARSKP